MHLTPFWTFTITGLVASWPPAAFGMWLTWYLASRKVRKITDDQTTVVRRITDRQTRQLLGQAGPALGDVPPDGV